MANGNGSDQSLFDLLKSPGQNLLNNIASIRDYLVAPPDPVPAPVPQGSAFPSAPSFPVVQPRPWTPSPPPQPRNLPTTETVVPTTAPSTMRPADPDAGVIKSSDFIGSGGSQFLYVDPRARPVPGPSTASSSYNQPLDRSYQAIMENFQRQQDFEYQQMASALDAHEAVAQKIIGGFDRSPVEQGREDQYDALLKAPGILGKPTADLEAGDSTFITEMDGKYYILPKFGDVSNDQARFLFDQTGEHLGVFQDLQSARNFEQNWLPQRDNTPYSEPTPIPGTQGE